MRETVLLVNFQDRKKLREIQMMLLAVKVRMKIVEPSEYMQSVGWLAGVRNMEKRDEVYNGPPLEQEMMVFAGVTEEHLNQILFLMKKGPIAPVHYKAVMTPTNQEWSIPRLYRELAREHEEMTGGGRA